MKGLNFIDKPCADALIMNIGVNYNSADEACLFFHVYPNRPNNFSTAGGFEKYLVSNSAFISSSLWMRGGILSLL